MCIDKNKNVTITCEQAILASDAIDELYKQDYKYPVYTGLRLLYLKKELNQISNYVSERVLRAIPKIKENTELTDEEKKLYDYIMNEKISIETFNLTESDIVEPDDVRTNLITLENLLLVL